MDEHPEYPNPIVQEVLCDITFELQAGTVWSPKWFGEFYNLVSDRYPGFEPVTINVEAQVGSPVQAAAIPLSIIRYSSSDSRRYLHLTQNKLLLNVLAPYPGWKAVREVIQGVWENVVSVINPSQVMYMGLRYINRIERTQQQETLGEWLVPTDYIPRSILNSKTGFTSVVQVRLDERNRIGVTTGELYSPNADAGPPFILDIDRGVEGKTPVETEAVMQEADSMHEHIWKVFDAATGGRLKKLLKGELL